MNDPSSQTELSLTSIFDDERMGFLYFHMLALAASCGATLMLADSFSERASVSEVSTFTVGFLPLEFMVVASMSRRDPGATGSNLVTALLGYVGALITLGLTAMVLFRWAEIGTGGDGLVHAVGCAVAIAMSLAHLASARWPKRAGETTAKPMPPRRPREWILLGLEIAFIVAALLSRRQAPEDGLIILAVFGVFGVYTIGPALARIRSRRGLELDSPGGAVASPAATFPGVEELGWCLMVATVLMLDPSPSQGMSLRVAIAFAALGSAIVVWKRLQAAKRQR